MRCALTPKVSGLDPVCHGGRPSRVALPLSGAWWRVGSRHRNGLAGLDAVSLRGPAALVSLSTLPAACRSPLRAGEWFLCRYCHIFLTCSNRSATTLVGLWQHAKLGGRVRNLSREAARFSTPSRRMVPLPHTAARATTGFLPARTAKRRCNTSRSGKTLQGLQPHTRLTLMGAGTCLPAARVLRHAVDKVIGMERLGECRRHVVRHRPAVRALALRP
jgi:hypothetical protein